MKRPFLAFQKPAPLPFSRRALERVVSRLASQHSNKAYKIHILAAMQRCILAGMQRCIIQCMYHLASYRHFEQCLSANIHGYIDR